MLGLNYGSEMADETRVLLTKLFYVQNVMYRWPCPGDSGIEDRDSALVFLLKLEYDEYLKYKN